MLYYLSLGTNLGDKERNLRSAIDRIGKEVGTVVAQSSFLATAPWGFESDNEFLNAAVAVNSPLLPLQLLAVTQRIEHELGRTEKTVQTANGKPAYQDRIIDIDILLCCETPMPPSDFGCWSHSIRLNTPELTIPHPHIDERDFVLIPLKEIIKQ